MKKLKHSKIGVMSFSISLIPIIYIITQTIIDIFMPIYRQDERTSIVLLNIIICIAIVSFILGLFSLFEKSKRKSLPIIGVVISCLILLIPILGSGKILFDSTAKTLNGNKSDDMNISFTPEMQIVDDDFSLKKGNIVIELNMNKNDLLKVINVSDLNNVTEKNVTLKNKTYKYIYYDFQGLNITLSNAYWDESNRKEDDFIVKSLNTSNNQWVTYRGIAAGEDISKVENVYGKLLRSEGENGFSLVLAKNKYFLNFSSNPKNKQKIGQISMSN